MSDILYMAWRYLTYHKVKTGILVASVTLIVYLPVGLKVIVSQSAASLTARAEATPLIIGEKGSPLELVLNSLYFESNTPPRMKFLEANRVTESGLAIAIPLATRFHAQDQPIVGTSLDYFDFRCLRIANGRKLAMLGECVIGAQAAKTLGVGPGDFVISSPENVFDIAGVYPLKMPVTGVLAPSGTSDDLAVFVDVKTVWVIEGLAHGHQDMSRPEAAPGVLRREGNVVVANASVVQYTEITPDNVDSFHFHGDPGEFPITAVIAVPHDQKAGTLLRGRYLGDDERVQIVEPTSIMDQLLATIFTVQSYVLAAVAIVSASTLATAVLVFMLSFRLRRREIETMHRIGGAKRTVFTLMASEVVIVLVSGLVLAAALTLVTSQFGAAAIRSLIA